LGDKGEAGQIRFVIGETVEVKGEFKSGLTWRSFTALLYSLLIFSPAAIYLNLVTIGGGLGSAVEVTTLFLFSELAAFSGNPITPQEAAMIFGPATRVAGGFLDLIYRLYFVHSPLLIQFGIDPKEIPWWFSPPRTSPVWDLRTFIHPDWLPIILVNVIVHVTSLASGIFFGLLARELFIEGERLPFPMQQIIVSAIITFSRREKRLFHVLSSCAMLGLIYGFILYTLPQVSGALSGIPIDPIPKPWVDLTGLIEPYLPGASFGIATSLTGISAGMMIPQEQLVIGIFVGSVLRFLVINPLLIKLGISEWAGFWKPGMNLTQIYQYSQLYFWLNPLIGVGFAVGIVPFIFKGRVFINSLISAFQIPVARRRVEQRISGPPAGAFWIALLFALGIIGSIALDLFLIPDFPLWVLILYEFVMPFLITLSAGRMVGLTGTTAGSLSIPYFHQITIIASGYPKISAWFLPLKVDPGTGWLINFKICQLTRTTLRSWIICGVAGWILSFIIGFAFTEIFWRAAPIPSGMYPVPAIMWPIQIMNTCVWITRPQRFFDPAAIAYWGVGFGLLMALSHYTNMLYFMIGIAAGLSTPIPGAVLILAGLIIKRIMYLQMGRQWTLRHRAIILAGIALGEGLASILGTSIMIIAKGISSRAY